MIDFGLFQTANRNMAKVLEMAQAIAVTPSPILVSGEAGVGKSLLVKFIIEKARSQKPIFRWGKSQENIQEGDIVIIENIEQLTAEEQTIISETMDEFKRKAKRVRWIATCSDEPAAMVSHQKLRKDLFYRLSVIHLQIPAIRNRPEDIMVLANFFAGVFNIMRNHMVQSFSKEAEQKLMAYKWDGNVTELESVIERAVFLSHSEKIESNAIEFPKIESLETAQAGGKLAEMERKLIFQTLQMTQQNKTKAAQILGISIRTLRNKLNEYKSEGMYESVV